MELEGMQCHGCGSTNVVFDPKRRILICNQCGKEEYYSRATLNANGKVVFSRRNAIRFFTEGKLEDARHYAMEVMNISMDNAPAMYILAYYDEFTARKPDSMRQFFSRIQDVALEYDEVTDIRGLLLSSACNLADYEENVIQLIDTNPDSPYLNNSFYLKAKANYFYEHYVAAVGQVISAINNPALKGKFSGVYQQKCEKYRKDAGIA